jgi:hypothetical protein
MVAMAAGGATPMQETFWNPNDAGVGLTVSGDGMTVLDTDTTGSAVRSTRAQSSGVRQFECAIIALGGGGVGVGVASASSPLTSAPGGQSGSWGYRSPGTSWAQGTQVGTWAAYGPGDIIGIVCDFNAHTIKAYKNGVLQGTLTGSALPATAYCQGGAMAGTAGASLTLITTNLNFPIAGATAWDD